MSNKKKNKDSEKLNPYFIDKLASVPAYLKIGFLKFWLAGASFLLAIYGLGARFDLLDRLVVFALIMILGVEYLTNTVILYMNKPDSPTTFYLPHEVNRKSFLSFFATAIYVAVMLLCIHFFLELWTSLGLITLGEILSESSIDPISFGLLFVAFDLLWINARKLIKKLLRRQK
jgi:hypothetical protein